MTSRSPKPATKKVNQVTDDSKVTKAPEAPEAKEVDVLFIQSKGERFRRCGREFNKNGEGIPLDSLTEEEIATLESEPQLSCQRTTAEKAAE
ncbi:MAG: hypothetical protein AB1Y26_07560 [Cycloclasticus sp.]